MQARPIASIIIRTRNEATRLAEVLEALQRQSERRFEVLVVDSGSTDATLEIARRFPVRLVHLPFSAFTFGRALNLGASLAQGQFLVNLSGHCIPADDHWLEHLLAPFADPLVAAVGGSYRPFEDADPFDRRAAERASAREAPFAIPPRTSGLFGNDNAAIRRSVWQKLPFDETVGGGEDFFWLQLALARGWRIIHQPKAVVYHSHLETPLQIFDRYLRGAFALERVMPRAFRHRLPVLALDATLGAFADVLYCLKTNQAEWSSYALKRRLARAFGRLLGARPWLMKGLYELNKLLAVPTLRLTQLAGFAQSPLHPKHLTRSLDHLWYLPFARAGEKALDMGAGSGLHSLVLAQQGLLVFAADYNASGLKALRQTAARLQRPPLPLVCNAERPWPFRQAVFDLVLLLDSLEHLHAPELALAEARRTLKPGGLLLATLPNRDTHWKLARRRVGVFDKQDPDHKHEYTLQEATDLLEAAGFTLLAPPEPITADLPAWSLVALASALWPVLYERLGNWKRRLARRFPRETTGWRFVAQKEAGHQ